MVKKSLIVFILFTLLHVVICITDVPRASTHRWQENVILAQKFLYDDDNEVCIVGTSLSAHIVQDSIPDVSILALSGCKIEDGLNIILNKQNKPKVVLIETNFFFDEGNQAICSIGEGFWAKLQSKMPSLQEQYKPVCILYGLIKRGVSAEPEVQFAEGNKELLDKNVARLLEDDEEKDPEEFLVRQGVMKSLIEKLEEHDVKVVFFEMPIDERLEHLKRYDQTREAMSTLFNRDRYLYLPSDDSKYMTTDGIHLSGTGRIQYTHYFCKLLRKYNL